MKGVLDLVDWQRNATPANYDRRALLAIAMLLCNYNVHRILLKMQLMVRNYHYLTNNSMYM